MLIDEKDLENISVFCGVPIHQCVAVIGAYESTKADIGKAISETDMIPPTKIDINNNELTVSEGVNPPTNRQGAEQPVGKSQLRSDIHADILDALFSRITSNESLETSGERLLNKIMTHVGGFYG